MAGVASARNGAKCPLEVSAEVLHRLTDQLAPTLAALKAAIRASPAVQADETGWREDGRNGYIWSASTPTLRYYEYHHSRGHEAVEALLGAFLARWAWAYRPVS